MNFKKNSAEKNFPGMINCAFIPHIMKQERPENLKKELKTFFKDKIQGKADGKYKLGTTSLSHNFWNQENIDAEKYPQVSQVWNEIKNEWNEFINSGAWRTNELGRFKLSSKVFLLQNAELIEAKLQNPYLQVIWQPVGIHENDDEAMRIRYEELREALNLMVNQD
jgi:hypothetical protein